MAWWDSISLPGLFVGYLPGKPDTNPADFRRQLEAFRNQSTAEPQPTPPLTCPPNQVPDQYGGCSFIPKVHDPDTGEARFCITDDECENPERHRRCPPGKYWDRVSDSCKFPWSPNPFLPGVGVSRAIIAKIAASFLGDLGQPAPKRAPGPARRPSRRRRTAPSKRPPARPTRPAPGRPRWPGPRIVPSTLPDVTLNPIDFVIREFELYTRPLGERRNNPRRGGDRTRARFPPMPPVVLPSPGPIPVDIPTPAPRRSSAPRQSAPPVPSAVPSSPPARPRPAPAPRARPVVRSNPLIDAAISALLSPLVSAPPTLRLVPQARPRQQPARQPIGDPLSPVQQPALGFATVAEPTNDPCAVRARDARRQQRRRRKQCKKFVNKTIRVCAD